MTEGTKNRNHSIKNKNHSIKRGDDSSKSGITAYKNKESRKIRYKDISGREFEQLPYEMQLAEKQQHMTQLLGSFGTVEPILGMEDPLHYRNKVHAVFGRDGSGRILCGEYKEGTHRIIEREDSPIEDPLCRQIIQTIKRMVIRYRIRVYDEDLRAGLLRHVVVRRGFASGEVMVILVCASEVFPSAKNFVKELTVAHPEITTVVLNINSRKTNAVLGAKERTLFGKGYITDTLLGSTFRISPDAFYQVNPAQTEVLYKTAIRLADLKEGEHALDAYCGTGTIGILAARAAGEAVITGVERNPDAVRDARVNAKLNNISNIRFFAEDASDYMERLAAKEERERVHVLFMDPPRAGSDERFLAAAVRIRPERIVYISCGPESLARDLKFLAAKGYRVKKLQPVDMFPFTKETEVVVLLQNRKVSRF